MFTMLEPDANVHTTVWSVCTVCRQDRQVDTNVCAVCVQDKCRTDKWTQMCVLLCAGHIIICN